MSRTIAVQVRYNSWFISLPSFAKQREMTKFCVVWRTWTTTAKFLSFYFDFNAVFYIQFWDNFDSEKQTIWLKGIARFVRKIKAHFFNRRCLQRCRCGFLNSLIYRSSYETISLASCDWRPALCPLESAKHKITFFMAVTLYTSRITNQEASTVEYSCEENNCNL